MESKIIKISDVITQNTEQDKKDSDMKLTLT